MRFGRRCRCHWNRRCRSRPGHPSRRPRRRCHHCCRIPGCRRHLPVSGPATHCRSGCRRRRHHAADTGRARCAGPLRSAGVPGPAVPAPTPALSPLPQKCQPPTEVITYRRAPGTTRTCDLGIRRPLLYPPELRRQCAGQSIQPRNIKRHSRHNTRERCLSQLRMGYCVSLDTRTTSAGNRPLTAMRRVPDVEGWTSLCACPVWLRGARGSVLRRDGKARSWLLTPRRPIGPVRSSCADHRSPSGGWRAGWPPSSRRTSSPGTH